MTPEQIAWSIMPMTLLYTDEGNEIKLAIAAAIRAAYEDAARIAETFDIPDEAARLGIAAAIRESLKN